MAGLNDSKAPRRLWKVGGTANYATHEKLPVLLVWADSMDDADRQAMRIHPGYCSFQPCTPEEVDVLRRNGLDLV